MNKYLMDDLSAIFVEGERDEASYTVLTSFLRERRKR